MNKNHLWMAPIAFLAMTLASCVSNDISSPENTENTGTNVELKAKSEYFDFSTQQDVLVKIDYKTETLPVKVSVYTENPYTQEGVFIDGLKPIFAAYTTTGGIFNQTVKVPSSTTRLYITTMATGYPTLLEESDGDEIVAGLPIEDGNVTWSSPTAADLSALYPTSGSSTTRATYDNINIGDNINTIVEGKLYTLYNQYSHLTNGVYYLPSNNSVSGLYSTVPNDYQLTSESTIGELSDRVSATLYTKSGAKKDNTAFLRGHEAVNLKVMDKTDKGTAVEYAQVDLVFLQASGGYHNGMAYYYYPSDKQMAASDFHALPKYVVFPRTTRGHPSVKVSARLQFFGANYNEAGTDKFPPGYTIGWMLMPNASFSRYSTSMSSVNNTLKNTYTNKYIYSNEIANTNGNADTDYPGQPLPGCMTLFDYKSKIVVIGFEDQAYKGGWGDNSFEDILFYASCNPVEAIESISKAIKQVEEGGSGDPEDNTMVVTEDPVIEPIWSTYTQEGTVAFEDLWPEEGDYDLNDMVVEYKTTVTLNQHNEIKEIVDEFKPVHNGASYVNAFGIIIDKEMGQLDETQSKYAEKEADNRFILWESNQKALASGETYKVVRTWEEGSYITEYQRDINPFLVVKYQKGDYNRAEVHLPMTTPSPWADTTLNNSSSDAYYVHREGAYPFAIDLFGQTNWEVNTVESRRIDNANAYPKFRDWADSKGASFKDWYKK